MKTILTATAVTALMATGAYAKTFSGDWSVSGDAFSDPGLVVQTDPSSGSGSFNLEVGDSVTFDLFTIWTDEGDVGGDDQVPQSIDVAFNMTSPSSSGSLDGSSVGETSGLFGFYEGASVSWDNPLELYFGSGDTGLLTISLSDENFNWGNWFSTSPGQEYGASVQATATYVTAPVPLPASAVLLLGGLAGLGAMRKRRKAA